MENKQINMENKEVKKINYHLKFKQIIKQIENNKTKPTLLIHICCAPCSSGCLEMLSKYFNISLVYYNPNISPLEEYEKRKAELNRFVEDNKNLPPNIEIINCNYESEKFKEIAKGLEQEPEGGKRCEKCFELRLNKTAEICKQLRFDYFTTSLSISPHKNSQLLNEIGLKMAEKHGVNYLVSDFKKEDGYKKSIENSKLYNLYRQDYCGCIYSKLAKHSN